ncbi:MAG TPA: hypothetical protein EYN72_07205, partial [Dehalococcoidia bacterium]|nr:hypothetical protein [Dehalococcoidia bacterium]
MTSGALIRLEGFTSVTVTNRTVWTFADFVSADGARTTVEITAGDSVMDVARDLDAMVARIGERDIESEDEIESMLGLSIDQLGANRVIATAVSGLRSAVVQLQAHSNGVSLTEALGGQTIESVPLYANINRGLFGTDRTPNAFCLMAERAREAGFTTFKCAPFDEVSPPSSPDRILSEAKTGLERVAAVRRAIGPEARLLVDCHSRFQRNTAPLIADELAKLGVSWFEEPVQPTSAIDELVERYMEEAIATERTTARESADEPRPSFSLWEFLKLVRLLSFAGLTDEYACDQIPVEQGAVLDAD